MIFLASVASFLFILLLPENALAWGPAAHLEFGNAVLHNAVHLSAGVASLLSRYPNDFLYGNISADIVVGKNLVEELKHCHNWKMGFKLLKRAGSDSQRAFACGYLSHLAADTVAHNNFIPEMMIRSFSARTLRHIYWELRFDALVDKKVWDLPKRMVRAVHVDNDRLLDSVIEDAPLSFATNKTIFSSVLTLSRFRQWHAMLRLLSMTSKWKLTDDVKERYFNACVEEMASVLSHGEKARCVKKDPTGKRSLNAAMFVRKRLKTAEGRGKDWREEMEKALRWACVNG